MKLQKTKQYLLFLLTPLLFGCAENQIDIPTPVKPPRTNAIEAPWIPVNATHAVAYTYTLSSMHVSGTDLCTFDKEGNLFVFSEPVTPLTNNEGIHAQEVDVRLGETFIGGEDKRLKTPYPCGEKTYQAIHIQGQIIEDDSSK